MKGTGLPAGEAAAGEVQQEEKLDAGRGHSGGHRGVDRARPAQQRGYASGHTVAAFRSRLSLHAATETTDRFPMRATD